jgi:hypothetical protein
LVPSGRSKSLGGTTMGWKDGIRAEGGLKYISGISNAFGDLGGRKKIPIY